MVPEAREVRLSPKDRKVLEARCRSPLTLHRDLKRARIVLLAAAGRSTRSIAKEVGVQPRIVSLWRHRFAEYGLEGLKDKPRPGKKPIYTKATDTRGFWRSWTSHRRRDLPGGQDRCSPRGWTTLMFNMSGGFCEATGSIFALANPGARATILPLRRKWLASTLLRPRRPLCCASMKNLRSRHWSGHKAI